METKTWALAGSELGEDRLETGWGRVHRLSDIQEREDDG
jgi:hypothetical protein